MKTRLLGAAVLIALAVLFVPMFFSSTPPSAGGDQSVSLAIPTPPDRELQTRTMSLTPAAAASTRGAPAIPAQTGGSGQLATVDIADHRPRDVGTDPAAVSPADHLAATQPAIPAQPPAVQAGKPVAAGPTGPTQPAAANAPTSSDAGTAAHASYAVNLSAYSSAGAQRLIQRVRALGLPASGRPLSQGGKALTLVSAGPFGTRTAAEAARLKITQTIAGIGRASVQSLASDQAGDAPAAPVAAHGAASTAARGYAVQVAAMGSQADANALRDKLRAAGFDGFVDSVSSGGRQLWRVRAGPQTRRVDALHLRDQIKARLGLTGNVVSVP